MRLSQCFIVFFVFHRFVFVTINARWFLCSFAIEENIQMQFHPFGLCRLWSKHQPRISSVVSKEKEYIRVHIWIATPALRRCVGIFMALLSSGILHGDVKRRRPSKQCRWKDWAYFCIENDGSTTLFYDCHSKASRHSVLIASLLNAKR